jgi:ATP/maltotriose-dependent transcriptional regulator MalT
VEVTGNVLEAYMALEKKAAPAVLQTHIDKLEPQKDRFPVYRMLYIILARLYRATGKLDKAIETLTLFLDSKQRNNTGADKDAAAAHYNRACYYALQEPAAADSKQKAIDDIKEAIARVPEYKTHAQTDTDFAALKDEQAFKDLIA